MSGDGQLAGRRKREASAAPRDRTGGRAGEARAAYDSGMKRGPTACRWRPTRLLIVLGIALIAAACRDAASEPIRREIVPDFFGEVESVIQGDGWSFGPTALSQGEPPYPTATLVGPATIVLSTGRELLVPADTPGSINCMKFITQADAVRLEGGIPVTLDEFRRMEGGTAYPERCAVLGEIEAAGNVAWFQLFPMEGLRIDVGALKRLDSGMAYTADGFGFLVAGTVDISCDLPDAPSTLDQALEAWGESQTAEVGVATGEVIRVRCLSWSLTVGSADYPITPGPLQIVAAALLVIGLLGLALGHRLGPFSLPAVGLGALLATLGVVTGYASMARFSDGPTGWRSVPDIFSSTFDSWPYVLITAACAAVLWGLVHLACSRRWDWRRGAAILTGAVVASVILGLLDKSL